jgi:GntR family transcriptional repressor for pyruvate dehydrogenase complex
MKKIIKVPIIDQVVERIKESIISGEFDLGKKLPSESSFCEYLKVSRSTVREAFRVLQTLGYVELKPGRGAFVRDNDPHDIETVRGWFRGSAPELKDFAEVRGVLETLAVRIAIEQCEERDLVALEEVNEEFHKAVGANDVAEIARFDEDFHGHIFSMTHNSLLVNLNKFVASAFRKYRVMAFTIPYNYMRALKIHDRILDAIRKKDVTLGVSEMAEHIRLVILDMDKMTGSGEKLAKGKGKSKR